MEYLASQWLNIFNLVKESTYMTRNEDVINLKIVTKAIGNMISNWLVVDKYHLMEHINLYFQTNKTHMIRVTFRDPKRTNRESTIGDLMTNLESMLTSCNRPSSRPIIEIV
jgi:hypothetical protein